TLVSYVLLTGLRLALLRDSISYRVYWKYFFPIILLFLQMLLATGHENSIFMVIIAMIIIGTLGHSGIKIRRKLGKY
ncbi:TPA: hypothetical protein ACGO4D_002410, partial [Streptococcus suis]